MPSAGPPPRTTTRRWSTEPSDDRHRRPRPPRASARAAGRGRAARLRSGATPATTRSSRASMLVNERVITIACSSPAGETRTRCARAASGLFARQVTAIVRWPARRTRSATSTASEVEPDREITMTGWRPARPVPSTPGRRGGSARTAARRRDPTGHLAGRPRRSPGRGSTTSRRRSGPPGRLGEHVGHLALGRPGDRERRGDRGARGRRLAPGRQAVEGREGRGPWSGGRSSVAQLHGVTVTVAADRAPAVLDRPVVLVEGDTLDPQGRLAAPLAEEALSSALSRIGSNVSRARVGRQP